MLKSPAPIPIFSLEVNKRIYFGMNKITLWSSLMSRSSVMVCVCVFFATTRVGCFSWPGGPLGVHLLISWKLCSSPTAA